METKQLFMQETNADGEPVLYDERGRKTLTLHCGGDNEPTLTEATDTVRLITKIPKLVQTLKELANFMEFRRACIPKELIAAKLLLKELAKNK